MPHLRRNPLVALILGWLFPGGGHFYLGHVGKGIFFFLILAGTFLAGVMIGGYDDVAFPSPNANTPSSDVTSRIVMRVIPIAQALDGVVTFATAKAAAAAEKDNQYLGDYEVGLLYTCVAGLLNLIVMLDAFCLAAPKPSGAKP